MAKSPENDRPLGEDNTLNLASTAESEVAITDAKGVTQVMATPNNRSDVHTAPTEIVTLKQPEHTYDSPNTRGMGSGPRPPSGFNVGELFQGKYEIMRLLGAGGMGQVYQARHIDLGTSVAIKILHQSYAQDQESIERFKREARASAKVVHPNAVRVFDYGAQGDICYLVMEYLEGESLRKRMNKIKKMSPETVLRFVEQVCYVLEIMHRKGIVHRDLKPDNIFFHTEDEIETVKVLDFGIAKVSASTITENQDHLTRPGTLMGTPHYMSPEQCQGSEELDGRSDLYSLGVIIYEMLSGRLPFEANNSLSVLYKHVNDPPPPLIEVAPELPLPIVTAVEKLLSKAPKDRFQTAKAFLEAFSEAVSSKPSLYLREMEKVEAHTDEFPRARATVPYVLPVKPTILGPYIKYIVPGAIALGVALSVILFFKLITPTPPLQTNTTAVTTAVTDDKQNRPINPYGENFVLIEGGTYTIGRDADASDCKNVVPECEIGLDETPTHVETLSSYYLSKYEVTNREYREFVLANNYPAPPSWRGSEYDPGADDVPVTEVSWEDAFAYCEWRSQKEGKKYRLPTEIEWEHAARGKDTRLRLFPWGNNWDNSLVNGNKKKVMGSGPLAINIAPNNNFDRSPLEIYALAGNVREWTDTDFKIYPGSRFKAKPQDFKCKVIRGGSYEMKPNSLRTTYRMWQLPEYKGADLGFRLAANAQ